MAYLPVVVAAAAAASALCEGPLAPFLTLTPLLLSNAKARLLRPPHHNADGMEHQKIQGVRAGAAVIRIYMLSVIGWKVEYICDL